jgi:hypothetical protein
MLRKSATLLALAVLPAACAFAPPSGPSVLATPGNNKDFATFQQDEITCRNYAQNRIGPVSPSGVAGQSTVNGAVAGTLLGAAAGAAIGAAAGNAGAGAAIGGGSGLLLGSSIGANNGAYAGSDLQREYDYGYIQCMTAKGDNIQIAQPGPYYEPGYYPGYAPGYAVPGPYYAPYPYAYAPPPFVASFGFGGGYYRHGGGWHGGGGWRGRR